MDRESLSIFSSKYNPLCKILLFSILILVVYNLIFIFIKPELPFFQSMREENIRNIEDYVYEHKDRKIVIVGSSLSARMKQEMLGNKFWNLAQQGGTSLTGLNIILQSNAKPDIVIIELNVINWLDRRLISSIFHPVLYSLREFLPSFREKYSPSNLILNFIRLHIVQSNKDKGNIEIREQKERLKSNPKPHHEALFKNSIEQYKREHYSYVDDKYVEENTSGAIHWFALDDIIQRLLKRNIVVVFLVGPDINANLPENIIKQNYFLTRYPYPNYCWLSYGMNMDYEKSDEQHMTYGSAWDFSIELRNQVSKCSNMMMRL